MANAIDAWLTQLDAWQMQLVAHQIKLVARYATLEGEFGLLNQDFIINQFTQVRCSVIVETLVFLTFQLPPSTPHLGESHTLLAQKKK